MKDITGPAIGIVAEYNPLHNGHRLHLAAALARCGDAPCVVVLSSNFTQRGEPAVVDKWTRTKMALACGVDLVIELPFVFAVSAAPFFSAGAVDLLARTRLATHIAFGMEDSTRDVSPILDILIHEPASFKQRLKDELFRGTSYARAAARALESLLPGGGTFLSSPNNLLAISYLLRVQELGGSLTPLPIQRLGAGHGDAAPGPLASSLSIRAALRGGSTSMEDGSPVASAVPQTSLSLLRRADEEGRFCASGEGLWPMLQAVLIRSEPEDLRGFDGMDEGMENLFLKRRANSAGMEDFVARCASGRYTRARIRRTALRLLAGVDRWSWQAAGRLGVPYARVLGATETGRALLRLRAASSPLPFITRLAAARSPVGRFAAQMEFRASSLYEALLPAPDPRHEERQRPIMA